MKMKKRLLLISAAFFIYSKISADTKFVDNYLYRCNEKLVEVVMEDLFNPPVSSRVYVYPNIAAYEVLAIGNSQLVSLSGQIKHLPKLKLEKENINYSIAAEYAFTTVAKKLVFSENMITDFEKTEKEIDLLINAVSIFLFFRGISSFFPVRSNCVKTKFQISANRLSSMCPPSPSSGFWS